MEPGAFGATEPHLDQVADCLDAALRSPDLSGVRDALAALGKSLGERYSVTLTCLVEVFDREQERSLPLLTTGLSTSGGADPFVVSGDSTPHRYVVDGEIRVVPHDHCPKCWGHWDFKWQHRHCPQCDAELGRNCKVLLDSDVCPHCEASRVTASAPGCSACGFVVDPALVVWG
jgi:hypothetical protein